MSALQAEIISKRDKLIEVSERLKYVPSMSDNVHSDTVLETR